MSANRQLCTFYVDRLFLGVHAVKVQEVIRAQEMTRVPLTPPVVRGLINLRGQIVTAIDLRRRLQLPVAAPDRSPMNVVIQTADGVVSLLVDEIGDVLDVPENAFERPPETMREIARALILGIYKLQGQLLLVLNTEAAVALDA